jgi:hypothetical protein
MTAFDLYETLDSLYFKNEISNLSTTLINIHYLKFTVFLYAPGDSCESNNMRLSNTPGSATSRFMLALTELGLRLDCSAG